MSSSLDVLTFSALSLVAGVVGYIFIYSGKKIVKSRTILVPSPDVKNQSTTSSCSTVADSSVIHSAFEKACESAKSIKIANVGDKLLLYGLYKQATIGDATTGSKKPSKLNIAAKAKYDAWMGYHQMPRCEAMLYYVEAVSLMRSSQVGECNSSPGSLSKTVDVASTSYFGTDADDIVYSDEEEYDENLDTAESEDNISGGMGLRPSTMTFSSCNANENKTDSDPGQDKLFDLVERNDVEKLRQRLKILKGNRSQTGVLLVNQTDGCGATPLHIAVDRGYLKCVELLLQNGSNPNAFDDDGTTVLQTAIMSSYCPYEESVASGIASEDCSDAALLRRTFPQLVGCLLKAGADPEIVDSDGQTARSVAVNEGKEWILDLLDNKK
mmetsp:Transcript_4505/g.6677  ORF Transcript_4505/g.6677 Transcript_4505/m.6677 type:complete len:383 (-) Transcript_4505:64-1212(-)|eukprot:CAMPEP_0172417660 /NCGR_PEP_ID=MMETSP1064-20121228/4198_1 /TAXON_ID=202472 /ORGANISM="Aulacoseira subarctica , Strain CCAP 1002/5" /LENGTH=382 /DNA_ID=CAMNT_0013156149 /DNA_START=51 /DNA_END=1199 /DNA_ORIENTATION=+